MWLWLKKVTTNIRYPFPFVTLFFALQQHYNNRFNCTLNASVEQNCVTVLKQIQLSTQLCFIPLPTALFDGVMCVFTALNNKSSDLYLLVMAQCTCRTRNWTIQPLGTCPQCAVRSVQENTEIYRHWSLRETGMDKFVVKFKDPRSASRQEVDLPTGFQWIYVSRNAGNLRLP
jgi:hypothetical protein